MRHLLGLVLAVSSTSAFAFPITSVRSFVSETPDFMTANYDFEGIVQLSNCSGSLVRFEQSIPTDKALVMTNGHCLAGGMPEPGEFVHNQATQRQFSLLSKDGQSRIGTVSSKKIVYATMTGTDIALYELDQTYQQISASYHVAALTMTKDHPAAGISIEILSGYWKRGYGCGLDGFVTELREAGYVFSDSLRYEVNGGCKTIHGTSGSPILQTGTRNVIGINNTGNDDGESCTMNNPCEVDANGHVFAEKGRSYGQQTHQVYSCLNVQRQVDLNVEGCELFKN